MSLKKISVEHNVDLSGFTSIKIGGKARDFFAIHTINELHQVIDDFGSRFYILGGGSNLLVKNIFIKKPIVKLSKGFCYIRESNREVEVGSSTSLSSLIKYCLRNDLCGLENLVGIPATIGGLLCMNASSFGGSISSCVSEVRVMDFKGRIMDLAREQIDFQYRRSSLRDYIILNVKFKLSKTKGLKETVADLLSRRLSRQDFTYPSCGSVFKNSSELAAGFLIESCGLKGLKRGQAQISPKHANFIINLGAAKYKEVDYLMSKIKERVYKKYSIILEEEIKRWS